VYDTSRLETPDAKEVAKIILRLVSRSLFEDAELLEDAKLRIKDGLITATCSDGKVFLIAIAEKDSRLSDIACQFCGDRGY
jgi:hypothetical protein